MKLALPGMTARAIRCRTAECKRRRLPDSPYCASCFEAILSRATRAAS